MNWIDIDVLTFQYFILVFARMASMVAASPIIGSASVPAQAKIGFSFLLSVIMFPIVSRSFPALPGHIILFWSLMVREALIGMLIGVISSLMFSAVQLSGQIFGMQVGFGIVNVMDPLSQEQTSLLGEYLFIIAILLFLVMDGHHLFIKIIANSYSVIPMGGFSFTESLGIEVTHWLTKAFIIAFKIGAPMIFSLLLISVAMGIIARSVPQMNIFIVGLPINIFVGLFVMAASLMLFAYFMRGYFTSVITDIWMLMKMAGGT
ncbi:MAG: flagellar biosynthetic protein FliR [bacterium]